MYNKIIAGSLTDRLDADFYKVDFIKNETLLLEFGAVKLDSLIDNKKSGYGVLPNSNEYMDEGGVKLIRGGDLDGGSITTPSIRVPLAYKVAKGTALEGDVLILIKGACIDGPSGVGRITSKEDGFIFNGSCYRLSFIQKGFDSYFFVAYSQTNYFLKQKKRWVSNTGISYNDESSIKGYLVPKLQEQVRNYIGNKVRQAELLREWAKINHVNVQSRIAELIGSYDSQRLLHGYVSPELLSNRLDQNHYQPHLIENFKCLMKHSVCALGDTQFFSDLTDGDHGNPIYGNGPIYLRTNEIRNGMLQRGSLPHIDSNYAFDVSRSCWANKDEVIFSVVGTLGMTAVIDDDTKGIMSRGIAKVNSKVLPNNYVKAYFKSEYFGNQLIQHSVGTIQRGVYLESLKKLIVPIFDGEIMESISEEEALADKSYQTSEGLVNASKLLVESLIDGNITEAEIIAAQQALDNDDNTKDKAILGKLTDKGYVAKDGKPLFSDLDALYELLDDAELAQKEKDQG